MRKTFFIAAAAAALFLSTPVLRSPAAPMIAAGAADMRTLATSDVEKVDYYFWGYYRPVYTFSTNPLAPRAYFPPGSHVYPPFWPYGYLPPFGYLDFYQTYGCLSPTRYCVFGELPY